MSVFKDLSDEQEKLGLRIFDLVLGRVFKSIFLGLNEDGKKEMERVFLSDDDKSKEKFIKKYAPNLKKFFEEKVREIEEKLKLEIEKQV